MHKQNSLVKCGTLAPFQNPPKGRIKEIAPATGNKSTATKKAVTKSIAVPTKSVQKVVNQECKSSTSTVTSTSVHVTSTKITQTSSKSTITKKAVTKKVATKKAVTKKVTTKKAVTKSKAVPTKSVQKVVNQECKTSTSTVTSKSINATSKSMATCNQTGTQISTYNNTHLEARRAIANSRENATAATSKQIGTQLSKYNNIHSIARPATAISKEYAIVGAATNTNICATRVYNEDTSKTVRQSVALSTHSTGAIKRYSLETTNHNSATNTQITATATVQRSATQYDMKATNTQICTTGAVRQKSMLTITHSSINSNGATETVSQTYSVMEESSTNAQINTALHIKQAIQPAYTNTKAICNSASAGAKNYKMSPKKTISFKPQILARISPTRSATTSSQRIGCIEIKSPVMLSPQKLMTSPVKGQSKSLMQLKQENHSTRILSSNVHSEFHQVRNTHKIYNHARYVTEVLNTAFLSGRSTSDIYDADREFLKSLMPDSNTFK